MIRRLTSWTFAAILVACGGGDGGAEGDPDASGLAADVGGAEGDPDATPPPLSLGRVSGDLTYVGWPRHGEPGNAHIYSALADGSARFQVTTEPGRWGHHAISPDRERIVAVRQDSAEGLGEVWIIDLRARDAYPISPVNCDAGLDGVGWRDGVRVMFAMRCGDELPAAYLADSGTPNRDPNLLLKVSDHDVGVRATYPAVGTPYYLYTIDAEACAGSICVRKPEIWLANNDTGLRCRLTDGDVDFAERPDGAPDDVGIGDHHPAFAAGLERVIFSRNVSSTSPTGPAGHRDVFRIAIERRAFFGPIDECAEPGTLENLSTSLTGDHYPSLAGSAMAADEHHPHPGPPNRSGALVLTATFEGGDNTVFAVDFDGALTRVSAEGEQAAFPRWVISDYQLEGER